MRKYSILWGTLFLALIVAGVALTAGKILPDNASRFSEDNAAVVISPVEDQSSPETRIHPPYSGDLRVFMCEITSRWKSSDGQNYGNGFLSFAFDTTLSLEYLETYQETKVYDISWTGWVANNPDSIFVREDNMKAIAVLYNSESSGTGISDPYYEDPQGRPFAIHCVDACASATHGNPGWDTAYGDYTHTVFIEESTSHT